MEDLPGDWTISNSEPSGGKAGKGCNKTTSIRVHSQRLCKFRYIRYNVGSFLGHRDALKKAHAWIEQCEKVSEMKQKVKKA